MTEKEFQQYLCKRHEAQIRWLSRKSAKYKRGFHILSVSNIVLSVTVPIVTAVVVTVAETGDPVRWVAVGLAGVVAIITGLQQLFRFKEQWTSYRATAELLKKERHLYDAKVGDYAGGDDNQRRSAFIIRVESILGKENENWIDSQDEAAKSGGRGS